MEYVTRFFRMQFARNSALLALLLVILLTGCDRATGNEGTRTATPSVGGVENSENTGQYPPDPTHTAAVGPEEVFFGEETLTAFLDRDGSDGYTGDYVLVYCPELEGGSKSTGLSLDGLVETTENRIPTREGTYLETTGLYSQADPYLTDATRQADPCYELDNGDLWQVGFQRVFCVALNKTVEMLFQVSAVGERCRVWSPVNPAYGPLEGIDPSYPDQLAREMDAAIPVLEQTFGAIPDIRGDGKMNILCFDFDGPLVLGFTTVSDTFDEIMVNGQMLRGNSLPIVHINTAPLIQGTYSELSEIYTNVVHEMQHSIFFAQAGESGSITFNNSNLFFTEFLAVAAQGVVYPGSSISHFLPWWYSSETVWEDLVADDAELYLRDKGNKRQGGFSLFLWWSEREDYSVALLLAHFVENRGGSEAFAHLEAEDSAELYEIMSRIWEELGYEDYAAFMEDFLLSILLHEKDGRYQLHPFEGYDPARCGGEEDPFSHLVPIITDKGLHVQGGGYAVLRPVGGVYYPPATASSGLRYVGITLKEAG